MNVFNEVLAQELETIRGSGLYRQLRCVRSPQSALIRMGDVTMVNFSSNDYLGLANEPALREAAARALADFGVGSGASRLISGSLAPHHELEQALAFFKGTEATLTFSSGYAAAMGIITALMGSEDLIILDKRVHASVIDAARLSGAKLRIFPHNDLDRLESILQWMNGGPSGAGPAIGRKFRRRLVVAESVYSMDGDLAPLREMVELKDRYGAWLMLDEAHATGLFGENRRGLAEAFALSDRVELQMGTLGKALGVSGGYVAGAKVLVDYLINRARSFIFSTAPLPAVSAAAVEAVRFLQSPEGELRRQRLWSLVDHVKAGLIEAGLALAPVQSPIIPWIVGDENGAVDMAGRLHRHGVFVPAIRYPTVSRGAARLRVTVTAAHSLDQIESLCEAARAVREDDSESRNSS